MAVAERKKELQERKKAREEAFLRTQVAVAVAVGPAATTLAKPLEAICGEAKENRKLKSEGCEIGTEKEEVEE